MSDAFSPIFPTTGVAAGQSFVQRLIELDIQLAPNPVTNAPSYFSQATAGTTNSNTLTITGARVSARIQMAGTPAGSKAQVDVFGMTPSQMNELSTLGLVFQLVQHNTLTIKAGDAVNGMSIAYIGTVQYACPDYSKSPEVSFHFDCQAGQSNAVQPTNPTTYPSSFDVGTAMSSLAAQASLGFENNGIKQQLPPGIYRGSVRDQIIKMATDAGIQADPDARGASGMNVLAIWPKGGSRHLVAPLVAPPPAGGMIGYPSYTQQGILIRNRYNPQIAFGGQIQVQSSLQRASGTWNVLRLDHSLDSLVENGLWESSMWCFNPKYPNPIPQV